MKIPSKLARPVNFYACDRTQHSIFTDVSSGTRIANKQGEAMGQVASYTSGLRRNYYVTEILWISLDFVRGFRRHTLACRGVYDVGCGRLRICRLRVGVRGHDVRFAGTSLTSVGTESKITGRPRQGTRSSPHSDLFPSGRQISLITVDNSNLSRIPAVRHHRRALCPRHPLVLRGEQRLW